VTIFGDLKVDTSPEITYAMTPVLKLFDVSSLT